MSIAFRIFTIIFGMMAGYLIGITPTHLENVRLKKECEKNLVDVECVWSAPDAKEHD